MVERLERHSPDGSCQLLKAQGGNWCCPVLTVCHSSSRGSGDPTACKGGVSKVLGYVSNHPYDIAFTHSFSASSSSSVFCFDPLLLLLLLSWECVRTVTRVEPRRSCPFSLLPTLRTTSFWTLMSLQRKENCQQLDSLSLPRGWKD